MRLKTIKVLGAKKRLIAVSAGMGAYISNHISASAAALRGWIGVVSSVALDRMVERYLGYKPSHFEAARIEIERAKKLASGKGMIFLNLMVAIESTYKESILGAIAGGVDGLIVGAGLPLNLPKIVGDSPVLLIPIVSSARALDIICQRWQRDYGRLPDAVILEGPKAGGHLGFKMQDIDKPEFQLELLLLKVLEVAGDIPVIVAGGIWDREDIVRFSLMGASGIQIGTRFAATDESGASPEFKRRIVSATEDEIKVVMNPGSPAYMPIRILIDSPGYMKELEHQNNPRSCDYCYLRRDGVCAAMDESTGKVCLCRGLYFAVYDDLCGDAIYTVGANAARVTRIVSVDELIDELTGFRKCA